MKPEPGRVRVRVSALGVDPAESGAGGVSRWPPLPGLARSLARDCRSDCPRLFHFLCYNSMCSALKPSAINFRSEELLAIDSLRH